MLSIKYQNEFDRTMAKVLPFLIFSNEEDKKSLADKCTSLFHQLTNENSENDFVEVNEEILTSFDILRNDRGYFHQISEFENLNAIHITKFQKIDDRFDKIEKNIDLLRDEIVRSNKAKKITNNIEIIKSNNVETNINNCFDSRMQISNARIKIVLSLIYEKTSLSVDEIKLKTGFSASSLSNAFSLLKENNLIKGHRVGHSVHYTLLEEIPSKEILKLTDTEIKTEIMKLQFDEISSKEIDEKFGLLEGECRQSLSNLVRKGRLITVNDAKNRGIKKYVKVHQQTKNKN